MTQDKAKIQKHLKDKKCKICFEKKAGEKGKNYVKFPPTKSPLLTRPGYPLTLI